ncbi:MAG TPA: Xaa-Pro peptidase family protein [Verrucomicrobiae bacterium]|nr:Xaa-Pro peptidase family protein [Verrucomicrobiae bacterium]
MNLDTRIDVVLGRMVPENIDLLIAASNGLHLLDRPDPAVHLGGYRSLGECLFLLYRDGTRKLIVSPAADDERVAAWRGLSGCIATDDIAGALARELTERGTVAGRIGTAGVDALPHRLAARLLALTGGHTRSFDDLLDAATGRKTSAEIERARRAVAIAERGLDRLLKAARPGMPECELAVGLNCYTKSLGADDNFLMLSASPHNRAVMPSSGRRLAPGDILLTEFTPSYEGQFAQICRTISVGSPSAELEETYDLVVRAMWAGIEAIRPGIPISEVCRAVDRVFEAAGYREYCQPPHMRRRGHGLGSGSIAPGDLTTNNDRVLEEDMIFVVHPNQYIPGTGYLLCGEPVRVTATGVETLTARTAALGVIPIGSVPCA